MIGPVSLCRWKIDYAWFFHHRSGGHSMSFYGRPSLSGQNLLLPLIGRSFFLKY